VSEQTGPNVTDEDAMAAAVAVYTVIAYARSKPFTTKSDFARLAANEVALCAVEGFITTKIQDDMFGNVWMVTQSGLAYMEELEDVLSIRH